jgi:hypothetical protein
MNLIKIGNTILNVNCITYANQIADGHVEVTYNAPTEEGPALWHSFKGEEAKTLWKYLSDRAIHL